MFPTHARALSPTRSKPQRTMCGQRDQSTFASLFGEKAKSYEQLLEVHFLLVLSTFASLGQTLEELTKLCDFIPVVPDFRYLRKRHVHKCQWSLQLPSSILKGDLLRRLHASEKLSVSLPHHTRTHMHT